jgi:hypothetical protein
MTNGASALASARRFRPFTASTQTSAGIGVGVASGVGVSIGVGGIAAVGGGCGVGVQVGGTVGTTTGSVGASGVAVSVGVASGPAWQAASDNHRPAISTKKRRFMEFSFQPSAFDVAGGSMARFDGWHVSLFIQVYTMLSTMSLAREKGRSVDRHCHILYNSSNFTMELATPSDGRCFSYDSIARKTIQLVMEPRVGAVPFSYFLLFSSRHFKQEVMLSDQLPLMILDKRFEIQDHHPTPRRGSCSANSF